jgi:asparagine synthase (glutamine-hydrolysing)
MSTVSDTPIKTFSIAFQESAFDESVHSRTVAKRFQAEHTELIVSPQEVLSKLDSILNAMDQPTLDGVNTYVISQAVRQAGVTVALSGLGGDELFAGYSSFLNVPRMERFASFWSALPASLQKLGGSVWKRFAPMNNRNGKLKALIAGEIDYHPYFLSRVVFTRQQRDQLLHAELPHEITQADFLAYNERILSDVLHLDAINRVSYLELTQYMANILLRDTDQMSMAHALEVRVPLIDHQLVELMLGFPGPLKMNRETPKHLLVRALKDLLPDSIVYRRKQGFTFPFAEWLRGELRSEVESVLLGSRNDVTDMLNLSGIQRVWQDFLAGRTSWSRPWALYVLIRWSSSYLTER